MSRYQMVDKTTENVTPAEPDTSVPAPAKETVSADQPPAPTEPAVKVEPGTKPRKKGPRNYSVSLSHGDYRASARVTKSSARAATASAVRSSIKHLPLRTPIKVWTKSSKKYYPFIVSRDTDNPKHKKFSLTKGGTSFSLKSKTPEHGIPDDL